MIRLSIADLITHFSLFNQPFENSNQDTKKERSELRYDIEVSATMEMKKDDKHITNKKTIILKYSTFNTYYSI